MSAHFNERNSLFGSARNTQIRLDNEMGGNLMSNRLMRNHDYFEKSNLRLKNFELEQQSFAFRPPAPLGNRFVQDLKWRRKLNRPKLTEISEDNFASRISSSNKSYNNVTNSNQNLIFKEPLGLPFPNFHSNINSSVTSFTNRPFESSLRNSIFGSKLQLGKNDETEEEKFAEGYRAIRERNSTLSSRLFSHRNVGRYERDGGSFNDLQVTHFSKGGLNSFQESRLGFVGGQNWMNSRELANSVSSVVSAKAQFINLLENLHHSILCIAPNYVADAVRDEFDKVKEKLDEINDISFAPSVKETTSVVSHMSKCTSSRMPENSLSFSTAKKATNLVTGKVILNKLVSKKSQDLVLRETERTNERRFDSGLIIESRIDDGKEDSALVFKKPKPINRRIKKMSPIKKSPISKSREKVINLTNWYPIAEEKHLIFCGNDEEGEKVKTQPVQKRISNKKVVLSNGFECNFVGEPLVSIVSMLPEKISNSLRNGVPAKWKVLQKALHDCQISIEKDFNIKQDKRRKSKTTSEKKSPLLKVGKKKLASPRSVKKKHVSQKKKKKEVSPKEEETPDSRTRSGRTVKPPAKFWLTSKNDDTNSFSDTKLPTENEMMFENSLEKSKSSKTRLVDKTTSVKISKISERSKGTESNNATPIKREKRFNRNSKSERSLLKASPKQRERKQLKESLTSNESVSSFHKERSKPLKRKRKMVKEQDTVQKKKMKQDKTRKVEESFSKNSESLLNTSRTRKVTQKKKPVVKSKKQTPTKRKKEAKNKKVETLVAAETSLDFQDFDLELDGIEVPEISKSISNPQLSRSQLRLMSVETPPLKYFNNNLKILQATTPTQSPDWRISQRTQSEVKQFQKRREECRRKKTEVSYTKTVTKRETKKIFDNKDLKSVMEWVAEKNVRSPQWKSKVLQYVIPSRKQLEAEEEEDYEEDVEEEY